MKQLAYLLVSCTILGAAFVGPSYGQTKFNEEAVAKKYSERVQPIYQDIDELRTKSRDASLSMNEAAGIVKELSSHRRKIDMLWKESQDDINKSFRDARDAINQYNTKNRQLEFESAVGSSFADVLKNVSENSTKTEFERNKPSMAASWEKEYGSRLKPFGEDFSKMKEDLFARYKEKYGVDLEESGYGRIGTSNPYDSEVYYKYYGPDGNAFSAQWKNDAEGYQKWKKDNDTFIRRQRDQKEQLERERTELESWNARFQKNRTSGGEFLASVDKAIRRINFVGTWKGNDNLGNSLNLKLYSDGTTHYAWGRGRSTTYSGQGTWQQIGSSVVPRNYGNLFLVAGV